MNTQYIKYMLLPTALISTEEMSAVGSSMYLIYCVFIVVFGELVRSYWL